MEAGVDVNAELRPAQGGKALSPLILAVENGHFELGAALLKAHADPDKIEQVLHNLLSNALRHTEAGEVTVSLGKDGGDIVIEVSDTGPGIPPEDRSRIFERFQKGESSDGLGIGLTIVRSIVEAHGGTVTVSDNMGKGSRFQARFPA